MESYDPTAVLMLGPIPSEIFAELAALCAENAELRTALDLAQREDIDTAMERDLLANLPASKLADPRGNVLARAIRASEWNGG